MTGYFIDCFAVHLTVVMLFVWVLYRFCKSKSLCQLLTVTALNLICYKQSSLYFIFHKDQEFSKRTKKIWVDPSSWKTIKWNKNKKQILWNIYIERSMIEPKKYSNVNWNGRSLRAHNGRLLRDRDWPSGAINLPAKLLDSKGIAYILERSFHWYLFCCEDPFQRLWNSQCLFNRKLLTICTFF